MFRPAIDPMRLPSVGDEKLDAQHRVLLQLGLEASTELGHTFDRSAHRLLNNLVEAIEDHFETEERKLAAVGYPDLDAHRQLHLEVQEKVADLLLNASLGNCSPVEITKLVLNWVEDHVRNADLPYAEFLERAHRACETV
ncbi:MAG: hemerythrin domain-containing protein [Rhodocyclaceae bacterium]|nr:hemerythrin domain-containing protein [Rhodocyclaceae bacterium]